MFRPIARQARLRQNEGSVASGSGDAPMSYHHTAIRAANGTVTLQEATFLKDAMINKLQMLDDMIPDARTLSKVSQAHYE